MILIVKMCSNKKKIEINFYNFVFLVISHISHLSWLYFFWLKKGLGGLSLLYENEYMAEKSECEEEKKRIERPLEMDGKRIKYTIL